MDSLKFMLCASALAITAALPAHAADLLPPPPMVEYPGTEVTELGTGWYLRGDIGYVDYHNPREKLPYGEKGAPLEKLGIREGYSFGGGVGYKFLSWLRADVTADFREKRDFSAVSSRTGFRDGKNDDRGAFSSTTVLLNGYLDLGNWGGITPYVGGGVGFASNSFDNYYSETTCFNVVCGDNPDRVGFVPYQIGAQGKVYRPNSTNIDFAWALMAGAAVDVGSGFKVDLGYRYVNMGEARTKFDIYGFGTKLKEVEAHEFRVGLRYMID